MNHARFLPALAALNGLLAVVVGAFGAHALHDAQAQEWIRTATVFQLPHAAAAMALIAWRPGSRLVVAAAWAMALGSLLFAGSLQALALGAPRAVAMAAPVGGAILILGWGLLLIAAFARTPRR